MGIPLIKSPLGNRGFEYEYGQTEFTEMLSYCLMCNIDQLADAGFEFSTDPASAGTLEIPQPLQVFVDQLQDGELQPIPYQRYYPEFPLTIWDQQTAAIQQQTATIERIKALLQEKYESLPAETKTPGYFQTLIDTILDTIAEEFIWSAIKLLFKGAIFSAAIFGISAIGVLAVKQLVEKLFDGISSCSALLNENQQLELIDASSDGEFDSQKAWEYFRLREHVITRHQQDIHNMLTEMIALESRVKENIMEPNENSSESLKELIEAIEGLNLGDLSELIQAVKDLQYNGQRFLYKDGSVYELSGQTVSGSE